MSNKGNVGIGIDDPDTKFHVNGKITVNLGLVANEVGSSSPKPHLKPVNRVCFL